MPEDPNAIEPPDAHEVSRQLAIAIAREGFEYAIGGAIALGFCATPRGTVDTDVTIYIPPTEVDQCAQLLQRIGCEFDPSQTIQRLRDDGYCIVKYKGRRVDVFLPIAPIYDAARDRRRRVTLGGTEVYIWDAETLCVFKMMFFRRKDLADVESILRSQGELDRPWIERQLVEMYGQRDPRISQWRELAAEIPS